MKTFHGSLIPDWDYLETLLKRWCYMGKFFSVVMSYYYDNNDNGNT